jgi:hypothetical protein
MEEQMRWRADTKSRSPKGIKAKGSCSEGWTYPRPSGSKALEAENTELKKLLADAMLDDAALKDLLAKKW